MSAAEQSRGREGPGGAPASVSAAGWSVPEPGPLEPDRFELREGPAYHFPLSRREFLETLGGGILVLCMAGEVSALSLGPDIGHVFGGAPDAPLSDVAQWLHIGPDGVVTVFTGKVEIGQDARTALAQVTADELRVPFERVAMVMGDTDLVPFDAGTFGSQSTPRMGPQLRRAAAAARTALLELAAKRWGVGAATLQASEGRILDAPRKRSLTYAELTQGQQLVATLTDDLQTTPADQWTVAGRSLPRPTARDIVTGRHEYPFDVKQPGVLRGKVLRPPAFGARLTSLDTRTAEAIPGVVVVKDAPGDDRQPTFVAVAAPDEPTATRALAEIRAEWATTPQPGADGIFDYLKANPAGGGPAGGEERGAAPHVTGDVAAARAAAAHALEGRYTTAYIAHVPLEPRAAVARWDDGKLTVWTGTQRPFGVRSELARAFSIPESRVRVLHPDMGSGYGGKHTGETAIEAARLAKAAGKAVKLTWTREEEFTWAYFRPAALIEIRSGIDGAGKVTAWEFHNYNSGSAALQTPYAVPNQLVQYHPARSPLRQGSYRALAATANHFARETHMDELARLAGIDALELRLRNLTDDRLRHVFQAAAEHFGWGKAPPAGHGFGIAGGTEKGSFVATCAEVTLADDGQPRVLRLVTAFDCGPVVNPANLRNQIEGAAIMGIGGALFEAIDFAGGRILNPRLSSYRVPRFRDVPQLETILVDRKDVPPAGAGETPIVGIAPAIGNALFVLTGRRVRSMPLARA
jgi:isoquinoline 1-oxidoreductase